MKLSIRSKLIIISSLLLIIPSLVIGIVSYSTAKESLGEIGAMGLKNNTQMALQLIDLVNEEVKSGKLTLEEAQEEVKERLLGELQADGTRPNESTVAMGQHGYFFVLAEDGTALVHPMLEGQNLYDSQTPSGTYSTREIIEKANSGGGFVTFEFAVPGEPTMIEPKIIYAVVDPHWGWIVTSGSYLMDFNSSAKDLLVVLALVLTGALVVGGLIIVWFSRHLSNPIRLVTKQVELLANGDLTTDDLVVKNSDEIGELTTHFNTMKHHLRDTLLHVSDTAVQVAATSEELSASSAQTSRAVEQVSESIQEMATGADTQVSKNGEVNHISTTMASDMSRLSEEMQVVNQTADEASTMANSGTAIISQTINQISNIQQDTVSTAGMINALGEKSNEIGQIVSLITNVAEQTNLLALNAAIEAARAGEHGKGFAVVADEVRKLAEQSRNSASQVNTLIQAIQEEIGQSVSAINNGQISVEEGIRLAQEAGNSFKNIATAVSTVSTQIDGISKSIENMSSEATAMVGAIDTTTEIAKNAAAHSQNIAAAAQQQTASMQEIAAASDTLAHMAEDLQESINTFKI